tara:strand:- start:52 stop:468 length:417 start_codon:yes stop_codon:yes gene_type:complete
MTGTFQGVGTLQFTPDNKHCFAYTGSKSVDNNITTMLEFTTASEYIIGRYRTVYFADNLGQNFTYDLLLNNVQIDQITRNDNFSDEKYSDFVFIIPPFTTVKFTGQNVSDTSTKNIGIVFTGKVLGTIKQLDLRLNDD